MSKSDFIFVGSPHTPITISGSDPYRLVPATNGGGANLACWYKLDPGMYVTGSDNSIGRPTLQTIKDSSGNPGNRYINRNNVHIPLVTSNIGQNLTTDALIQDPTDSSQGEVSMRNHNTGSADNSSEWSTWITGSSSSTIDHKHETSIFATMKYISDGGNDTRPFTVRYGTAVHDDDGNDGKYATFSLGLFHDNSPGAIGTQGGWYDTRGDKSRGLWVGYNEKDGTDIVLGRTIQQLPSTYNCIGLTYTGTGSMLLSTYANGNVDTTIDFTKSPYAGTDNVPGHKGSKKIVAIGGANYDWGSGYSDGANATSSIGEFFAFDDALSDIRRQQMERYMCDKYDIAMSSSYYLSQFEGGAEGTILAHSSSYPDPSGSHKERFARKYTQQGNVYYDFNNAHGSSIHYETAAGAFLKSNSNSGKLYESTGSVSLRAWVRAENISDSKHAGSHVALVARATEPYGHQMDNIRGYAGKFGTFKDGVDTGDLKFRLSCRDARQFTDGGTGAGFDSSMADVDAGGFNFSPEAGKWYQMRLDVDRSGSVTTAGTGYNTVNYTTKTANFNRTQHDASGTIGNYDTWNKLIGTRAPTDTTTAPYFTHGNHRIHVSSGSYWDDNLWNSNDGDMTISAWIYPNGKSANQYPRAFGWGHYSDADENTLYFGQYGTNNNLGWLVSYNGQRYSYYWRAKLTPYTWNHVVVKGKWAADANDFVGPILYLNGTKYDSYTEAGTSAVPSNAGTTRRWLDEKFIIGGSDDANDYAGNMSYRDVGVWNAVVTDLEAAKLYKSGSITNGYDTLTSKKSLCRAYYELTGAVSAPKWGEHGDNSGYMQIGNSSYWNTNLSTNNGEFTLMGWFNITEDENETYPRFFSWGLWGENDDFGIQYQRNNSTSGKLSLNMAHNGVQVHTTMTDTDGVKVGRWHHIIATGRRGTTYGSGMGHTAPKIYLDGVEQSVSVGSTSNSTAIEPINHELNIGQNKSGTERFDHLSCREVGIWNKILTGAEVTTAYNNAQFRNNSTIQNGTCKGYWRFNEPTANSGYVTVQGSNDMVYPNTGNYFWDRELLGGINRGKITWSGWIYTDWSSITNSNYPVVFQVGTDQQFLVYTQQDGVALKTEYGSTDVHWTFASQGVADNTWQHFAIVWDAGATYADHVDPILYVNGVAKSPTQAGGTPGGTDTVKLMAGEMHIGLAPGSAGDFTGRFRQFAFWNRLLSSGQVTSLYNSGTPASAISVQSEDLVSYWPMNGNLSDTSGMGNHLIRYNGGLIEGLTYTDSMSQNNAACTKIHHRTDIHPFGMYLDASNSMSKLGAANGKDMTCTTPTKRTTDPKKDSYTIMGWAKGPASNDTANGMIIDFSRAKNAFNGTGQTNYNYKHSLQIYNDEIYWCDGYENGKSQQVYATDAWTFDQWNHLAVVVYPYSATKAVQFYVNGVKYDHTGTWTARNRLTTDGIGQAPAYDYEDGAHNFTKAIVGLGYGSDEQTFPMREYKGVISDLTIYQGALSHQEISGAYNDGNLHSTTDNAGTTDIYDTNILVSGSATSWNQVGYWKMGNTSHHQPEAYSEITNDGGFTDHSIGSANIMLTSSATVAATDTGAVQEPYPIYARTDGTDTVRLWAREDALMDWQFAAEKVISHSGSRGYRYVSGERYQSSPHPLPSYNGRYNGYWVAMSSSNGKRLETEYYIDNLEIITSGSRV